MGFATWAEMRRRPAGQIMADYDVTDEHGQPGDDGSDPVGAAAPRRNRAEPLLIRTVHRGTGRRPLEPAEGLAAAGQTTARVEATIMIIEDVTEQRLGQLRAAYIARATERARLLAGLRADAAERRRAGGADDRRLVRRRSRRRVTASAIPVAVAHVDPERLKLAEELRRYEPAPAEPRGGSRARAAHRRARAVSGDHRRDARGRGARRPPPRAAALGRHALGGDRPGPHAPVARSGR